MNIWSVSMEYAGINEAGGVKNVTCSLSEELARCGNTVTVFLPAFGCTSFDSVENLKMYDLPPVEIAIAGRHERVSFSTGTVRGTDVHVVFVHHPSFSEKQAVYTYTAQEEQANSAHRRGCGHEDMMLIDSLFQRAVVAYGAQDGRPPDIIHCHDAACALLPAYVRESGFSVYAHTACVVTIHNAGPAYHHEFADSEQAHVYTGLPTAVIESASNGRRIEPYLIAAAEGAAITTVSEQYAQELTDPANNDSTDGLAEQFIRLHVSITGITNGIDFERYNPAHAETSLLPFVFDAEHGDFSGKQKCREYLLEKLAGKADQYAEQSLLHFTDGLERSGWIDGHHSNSAVFFAYHGRVVSQKGIKVFEQAAETIIQASNEARFLIIGQGDPQLEQESAALAEQYPGQFIFFKGYNRATARLISASSDFMVLPSEFEPCGLEDFIAQIYGTLPVAHATGGLKKIRDGEDGFLFTPNTADVLTKKLGSLIEWKRNNPEAFSEMAQNAASFVHRTYTWQTIVEKKYLPFFASLLTK